MFGWRPGVGDPTLYGWTAFVAFAVAGMLCWWTSMKAPRAEQRWWAGLALLMAFLCINKQLDLQTLFFDAGRVSSRVEGWYPERHLVQLLFVTGLGAALLIVVAILLRTAVAASKPLQGAVLGTSLLLLFVLIRASSFAKVDLVINRSRFFGGDRANHAMELGGILVVSGSALWAQLRRNMRRR